MTKKAALLLVTALLILLAPLMVSFGQMLFTDAKIVPVYFSHYYLARVNKGDDERLLLIDYLSDQGYKLVENTGERMVFMKGGEKKEVKATDIKIVFRDGKLASDFRLPK
ncbi:MAG: hypothetical protein ACOYU3_04405 [Bacillota bacterium]